jgi:radical SAM protein with 4Fe4S-binding SPASM domain
MQGTPYEFFVQWHLTEKCNLRCKHCYQEAVVGEMSGEEILRAIDEIKDTVESWAMEYETETSPSFHFTGGEPLLRRELFTILDYAHRSGFSTAIMTNGTLITRDVARRLREARVGDVQVSLDGLEAVHDSIRGRGSFARALNGIRNLVAGGVDVGINLTLSRLNTEELFGLVPLAEELGVRVVSYSRLVVCGRGKQLHEEMLTPRELASLHRRLREFPTGSVALVSRDPLASVAAMRGEVPEGDFPIGGCAAGVFGITIASDGGVMPCRRMDLTIGNIRQDSFRQLWAESPVLWSLRQRRRYHGNCRSCRYWAVCRGCRAVALARARVDGREDYLGPDPQCPYYVPSRSG